MSETVKETEQKRGRVGDGTPGPGRKAGVPNKVTTEFRATIQKLLDDNRENVSEWLSKVATEDPAKALDLLAKLAEFAAPKLSRTEVTGKDGKEIPAPTVTVHLVGPKA